jgi:hypothetical protein
MRAEDIPDWIPSVIKEMALAIPVGETISRRLLTDLGMKGVWKYLQSREVNPTALAALKSWQRLENWDIPIQGPLRQDQKDVSLQDRACAAFFAYAVVEFSNHREIWTRQEAQRYAEPWFSAAIALPVGLTPTPPRIPSSRRGTCEGALDGCSIFGGSRATSADKILASSSEAVRSEATMRFGSGSDCWLPRHLHCSARFCTVLLRRSRRLHCKPHPPSMSTTSAIGAPALRPQRLPLAV